MPGEVPAANVAEVGKMLLCFAVLCCAVFSCAALCGALLSCPTMCCAMQC